VRQRGGGRRKLFEGRGILPLVTQQLASMTERHPNFLEVLIGEIGQDGKLMSFSAKRCAYCPRPSFSSQSATCCIAERP
jgi:hypothetical protein